MRLSHVVRTWWPLAASWLLMGAEGPAISAAIARLPNPRVNLAAYGGVAALVLSTAAQTVWLWIRARVAGQYGKERLKTRNGSTEPAQ